MGDNLQSYIPLLYASPAVTNKKLLIFIAKKYIVSNNTDITKPKAITVVG